MALKHAGNSTLRAIIFYLLVGMWSGAEKQRKELKKQGRARAWIFYFGFTSQKQIRKLSDEIHSCVPKIDVLINNAGGVFGRFELSEDGIEKTFALNHLNYFLLTNLLLDLLPSGSRIINVSSHSHFPGKIDFESFRKNKRYNILKAYEQSKLANVLFTYALARKLE